MKPDQIDALAPAVLRDFEQIEDAKKTGLARQIRSDIRKTDRLDRIDFDFALVHAVPCTGLNVRTRPDTDAACDVSATNSLAQALGENHTKSLHGPANAFFEEPKAHWIVYR